jgi:hypothetical protein
MPTTARRYVYLVTALGVVVVATAFRTPLSPSDPLRFATYILLSLMAAALKLRLPGLTGTMSIGFLLVLLGIAELSLPETMLLACIGVVAQCLWKAQQRPTAMQVIFNVSAVAISAFAAFQVSQLLKSHTESIAMVMALATCCYFVSNSMLVSGVLSRVQAKPFRTVWQQCYLLSFPYYLLGGGIAGLMAASSREMGWELSLVVLPVMGLVFVFYHIYFDRLARLPGGVAAMQPSAGD